jgi:hypothetical protein
MGTVATLFYILWRGYRRRIFPKNDIKIAWNNLSVFRFPRLQVRQVIPRRYTRRFTNLLSTCNSFESIVENEYENNSKIAIFICLILCYLARVFCFFISYFSIFIRCKDKHFLLICWNFPIFIWWIKNNVHLFVTEFHNSHNYANYEILYKICVQLFRGFPLFIDLFGCKGKYFC